VIGPVPWAVTSPNPNWTIPAITLICVLTAVTGAYGLRLSRTTSDFYVASRSVTPWWNASALGGEYLSAASFLGVAGLVFTMGLDMLWFPVGYTLGYLVLLVLVAAPLRRSGAYTLPDFAEARLESRTVRIMSSVLVVIIGWLYLIPLLKGAGLALNTVTGAPNWLGSVIVATIVTGNVLAGGMRSITLVQAFQYWFKLAAIAIPVFVLAWWWWRNASPMPTVPPEAWLVGSANAADTPAQRAYTSYATLLGLCLGTMGLPHVVVRYYTNPDGRAARRTTIGVIALISMFYVFPPLYGILGRSLIAEPAQVPADSIVLLLPSMVTPGMLGDAMTGLLSAGAFAAFLSTASGLAVALAGVLDQDILRPRLMRWTGGDSNSIQSFRLSTGLAMVVPLLLLAVVGNLGLAATVGLAFTVAASTFCPLLVLGVWWRRLSVTGAAAGLVVGGVLSLTAVVAALSGYHPPGWPGVLLAQPAAWSVPAAFLTSIVVSLSTPERIPRGTLRTMVRLHTPEAARLDVES
jgi:cation/acetate symporter